MAILISFNFSYACLLTIASDCIHLLVPPALEYCCSVLVCLGKTARVFSTPFQKFHLVSSTNEKIFAARCTSTIKRKTWHFKPQSENSFKNTAKFFCFDLSTSTYASTNLSYCHEKNMKSQKLFFFSGEWAWHVGAIKMLVVFETQSHYFLEGLHLSSTCGIRMEKKGRMNIQVVKQFFTSLAFVLSRPLLCFFGERNNMELLCAAVY